MKVNNNAYIKRNYNKLLLNYYWHISNDLDCLIKYSIKKSGPKWFNTIKEICQTEDLIKKYGTIDKNKIKNVVFNNRCLECNKFIDPKRMFCSNKCSNLYKSKDQTFIENLRFAVKNSYKNRSQSDKNKRNKNISASLKKTNSKFSSSELKQKYSNKTIRYSAFLNLNEKYPEIELLFDEDFYYNNVYLPVRCTKCNSRWEMTKSTTLCRTKCTKCNPHKKHKTQTEIFRYITKHVHASENAKNIISNELDIYVNELNFAIEYNGLLPHSFGLSRVSYYNNLEINSTYHLNKTLECENKQIQLYHIFENEFLDKHKRKIWYSVINDKLGINERIYARKCTIKEITSEIENEFIERTHLQGRCQSKIKLGLYYNENLVSVMTFRLHKKYQWEIARFSNELNVSVIGGASKLLKHFERNYSPKSIISFANRRWSQGNLYEKLGFTFIENTRPNYFYFKENENILYSREKFQKHKLKTLLKNFDSEKTEIENMLDNGYRIIFDSGNKKYIKIF